MEYNLEHNAEDLELQEILNRIIQGIMSIITTTLMCRFESIMLYNLIIMLFGISPIFCLLCSFLCFLGMYYADNVYLFCIK